MQYGGGTTAGLQWAGTSVALFLNIPRPGDWDGKTPVTFDINFVPLTASVGNLSLFIRPRGYNPGDFYADASILSSPPVSAVLNWVGRQRFIIPPERFGTKELWVIAIQRGGQGETYTDNFLLLGTEISYTAVNRVFLTLIDR